IAFGYVTTLTNTALSKEIPGAVEKAGATLTTSEAMPLAMPDVLGAAASLTSGNPDVILISTTVPGPLTQAIRTAGYAGPVISLDGSGGLKLYDLTDPNMYAMSVYEYPDPASNDAHIQEYVKAAAELIKSPKTVGDLNNGLTAPTYYVT